MLSLMYLYFLKSDFMSSVFSCIKLLLELLSRLRTNGTFTPLVKVDPVEWFFSFIQYYSLIPSGAMIFLLVTIMKMNR